MPSRVHNLTFHGVGAPPHAIEPDEAKVWIGVDAYRATLDAVHGRDDVRVSFDDGNRSDVDVALPALVERSMTATFFVLAGRLGEADYLGPDDVRTLVQAGMTIGSHGLYHRDWRRLGEAEMQEELVTSRRLLTAAGAAPASMLSVPFGSYDRTVLRRIRAAGGYARVFTSDGGPARRDAWLQARTSVTVADSPGSLARAVSLTSRAGAEREVKKLVKRWR